MIRLTPGGFHGVAVKRAAVALVLSLVLVSLMPRATFASDPSGSKVVLVYVSAWN